MLKSISLKRIMIFIVLLGCWLSSDLTANDTVMFPIVSSKPPLKNIITVAKANGKFTDPAAAVNSITDASAANPYLVYIAPGEYTLTAALIMKPYVDICGSGENVTLLKGAISSSTANQTSAIVQGANNACLSNIHIKNTGGLLKSSKSIGIYTTGVDNSFRMAQISAGASGAYTCYGVLNSTNSSPVMTDVTASASGVTGSSNYGVFNTNSASPVMTHVNATATGGIKSYGVYAEIYSDPLMTHVIASASSGTSNYGMSFDDHCEPTLNNVTATASDGTNNYGMTFDDQCFSTLNNVTATASGGTISRGLSNFGFSYTIIRRSTVSGSTNGLYCQTTEGIALVRVSQSTIMGNSSGACTCIFSDNGSGFGLTSICLGP